MEDFSAGNFEWYPMHDLSYSFRLWWSDKHGELTKYEFTSLQATRAKSFSTMFATK